MNDNAMISILTIVLSLMIVICVVLLITLIILKVRDWKNKNVTKKSNDITTYQNKNKNKNKEKTKQTETTTYSKQSIFDFMEFEKVEDNMIIQKEMKKYLMVVECQGINYDLMSRVEKVSVEEGFQQFLNTLRHPIQIYIQARTVNLEGCIVKYKEKVKEIEEKYNKMSYEYKRMKEQDIVYTKQDLDRYFYELTKQKNLLEYGKDIIANTEKMSLNQNILNRKYFIIIPYYVEDANKYDKEEMKNIAFSELYTKSQSIIRALSACSVSGKILNSTQLLELLYMAYNRDDAEIYGLKTASKAQYDSLYSTSQDVFERKIQALDEEIREKAIDLANEKIEQVKSRKQEIAEEKEENMEDLVKKMAELFLNQNKKYVGQEVADQAIKELKQEEGGESNEEIQKPKRGRKRKQQ